MAQSDFSTNITLQGGEMCHFPFKHKNVVYTSCSYVNIPGFNMNGEPWCATQVESDGISVKEHKWSLCQDERSLILDGDGKLFSIHLNYLDFDHI